MDKQSVTALADEERVLKRDEYLEELQQIAAANDGMLRAEDVVAFARDPATHLHGRFTWNNSKAAEQWRLMQARQIIRVSITYLDNVTEPVRAFVSLYSDRSTEGGGYRPSLNVLTTSDLREEMLADAFKDLQVLRHKYASLKELADVFAAIDALPPPRKRR